MNVLLVDNASKTRQSMKALLEIWFSLEQVREASDGTEAVQQAGEFQPDLILMEVRMPTLSGLEATRQIKARWPQIKIVILSLYTDYRELAMEVGADGFMCKSEPPEILHDLLKKLLGLENV